jgi:Lrp/AsnC family leucine-responsive transcriptional regulator
LRLWADLPINLPFPVAMNITELDKLDRAILGRLQTNGRETYDVIGAAVGLSASAVLRRVKRLEEVGVIDRYVALVRPEAVGLGLTAYLNVRLEKLTERHKRNPMDQFRASVQTWPEVVECAALTGEMDYLLRVVVQDMAHYSRFIMDTLLKHPSVEDCKTSFVLDRVKGTTALPV